jgi:hypothetical protein
MTVDNAQIATKLQTREPTGGGLDLGGGGVVPDARVSYSSAKRE